MKSIASLQQLYKTSISLSSILFPLERNVPVIKKQIDILQEITSLHILKLVVEEDEQELHRILMRLCEGTHFYAFTFLSYQLSRQETDFDFLTLPENLPLYEKMEALSESGTVKLFPYMQVLRKIADNRQYGLYSENQEISFFLDEYGKYKDSIAATEFLHQFKKILKYRTQRLFEQFIHDGIFLLIQQTLTHYSQKIQSEQTLVFYVYGLHYYTPEMSNDDETFLLEHLKICVAYLSSHEVLEFQPYEKPAHFPNFESDKEKIQYFLENTGAVQNSADKFIGLFKDVCPIEEVNDFCDFLYRNFHKKEPKSFDSRKNEITRSIVKIIREKATLQNQARLSKTLYMEICDLLPLEFICERLPAVKYLKTISLACYAFSDSKGTILFYATEDGNKSSRLPPAHSPVEVQILEKDENGIAVVWDWCTLSSS